MIAQPITAPLDADIAEQRARALRAGAGIIRRIIGAGPAHFATRGDRSPMGGQLEAARAGTLMVDDRASSEWRNARALERETQRYALREALWRELRAEVRPLDVALWQATQTTRLVERERTVREAELLDLEAFGVHTGGRSFEGTTAGALCRRLLPRDPEGRITEPTCPVHRDRHAGARPTRLTAEGEKYRRPATRAEAHVERDREPVPYIGDRAVHARVGAVYTHGDGGERVAMEYGAVVEHVTEERALDGFVVVAGWREEQVSHAWVAQHWPFGACDDRECCVDGSAAATCALTVDAARVAVGWDALTLAGGTAPCRYWPNSVDIPRVTERQVRRAIGRFYDAVRRSEYFRLLLADLDEMRKDR